MIDQNKGLKWKISESRQLSATINFWLCHSMVDVYVAVTGGRRIAGMTASSGTSWNTRDHCLLPITNRCLMMSSSTMMVSFMLHTISVFPLVNTCINLQDPIDIFLSNLLWEERFCIFMCGYTCNVLLNLMRYFPLQYVTTGKVVKLSESAEEVATFYARMLDHDYTTKDVFNSNFMKDWKKVSITFSFCEFKTSRRVYFYVKKICMKFV